MNTTQDLNDCPFFADAQYDEQVTCTTSKTGNDRVYSNGLVTEDNGMGYWVTKCPFFVEERKP